MTLAAARLMVERQLRGLSVREAAALAGIDHSVIVRFENGSAATYASVVAYARALGFSVDPHRPGEVEGLLLTSGEPGTYREVVRYLEAMRREAGETQYAVSRRVGNNQWWWRKLFQMSGPILDTINRAASAYGYRLALVPVGEEVTDGRSEKVDHPGG